MEFRAKDYIFAALLKKDLFGLAKTRLEQVFEERKRIQLIS